MRHLLLIFFALTFSLHSLAREFSYEYEEQTIKYTVLDEAAKTVETSPFLDLDHTGNKVAGTLVLPAHPIDDNGVEYTLVGIGEKGFWESHGLTSITFPNTLLSIGEMSFYNCPSLTTIEFPASLSSIGPSAFAKCIGLTFVEIPTNVTEIGIYAFAGCCNIQTAIFNAANCTTSYYEHIDA